MDQLTFSNDPAKVAGAIVIGAVILLAVFHRAFASINVSAGVG